MVILKGGLFLMCEVPMQVMTFDQLALRAPTGSNFLLNPKP